MDNDFAIVIPSCDNYSDVWEPLLRNLKDKWPDNEMKIYLVTNYKEIEVDNVEIIKVGEDISWSSNLKKALSSIQETKILLLIDDLFLCTKVEQKKFLDFCKLFKLKKMNYLRLNPTPYPSGKVDENGIGRVDKGDIYRTSTVLSIWEKKILYDLLDENENAWEFEINGSLRSDKYENWYACRFYFMPTVNLIIKGEMDPRIYRYLSDRGINISTQRKMMNKWKLILLIFREYRSKFFILCIPAKYQRFIRNIFKRS